MSLNFIVVTSYMEPMLYSDSMHGSFSTPIDDCMINVFALLRASQTSHIILSILKTPIDHEQAYIRIALLPLDLLKSPHLFETLLSEILYEISHITSMLDLKKKIIKGFRSNKSSVWFDSLLIGA